MPRYFLEVAYVGTRYSGFQVQLNANTIQAEITRALKIYFKKEFELTGSSRTDAGVHAFQNFFHFDYTDNLTHAVIYNLNALLPFDIVIKNIFCVDDNAHCRFDAVLRTYHYTIIRSKDPFYFERSYYYPFTVNTDVLQEAAAIIPQYTDFTSFSKKKTQVKSFTCSVQSSKWIFQGNIWRYEITADRFLRGMVKGLVGTMLTIAKSGNEVATLSGIFECKNPSVANFSVSSSGLFLVSVKYKSNLKLLPLQ